MKEIIDIFNMDNVSVEVRCNIIIQLGICINAKYSYNLTEPLVYELVKQLDPNNHILADKHYIKFIKK